MFAGVGIKWKKVRSPQTQMWREFIDTLTGGLIHVGKCI